MIIIPKVFTSLGRKRPGGKRCSLVFHYMWRTNHGLCLRALEQRQTRRSNGSPSTQGHSGDQSKAGNRKQGLSRPCSTFPSRASYEPASNVTKPCVRDMAHGEHVSTRTIVVLQKTLRPVQFEITFQTRASVEAWIRAACRRNGDFHFHSRGGPVSTLVSMR